MDDPVTGLKTWYFSQPRVTRTYLLICFVLTVLVSLKFLNPYSLYYTFSLAFLELEIWRAITTFFFMGKFGFGFIFQMMFAYMALKCVETQIFDRRTYADFLWLIVYLVGSLLLIGSLLDLYFLTDAFVFALIYIWCKRRPFQTIRMMFGFQVKSGYFPWVFMGIKVLMGDSLLVYLSGLFLGHLYITVKDIFTAKYHKDYLRTPNFFRKWVDSEPVGDARRPQQRPVGPFGGAGVRIG